MGLQTNFERALDLESAQENLRRNFCSSKRTSFGLDRCVEETARITSQCQIEYSVSLADIIHVRYFCFALGPFLFHISLRKPTALS